MASAPPPGRRTGAPLRIGFIGAGLRGTMFAQLMGAHDDVEIVGVFDAAADSGRRFATATRSEAFPRLDALLSSGLDAVVVATPDHLHLDAALAAIESGATVLLEKPLATTVHDGRLIRDAVASNGSQLSVAFLNRWHPGFARVLHDARAGALGKILFQNARLSNSLAIPLHALGWAAKSSPGWFLMPHSVDLVAAIAPRAPVTVRATGHRGVLAGQGVDTWDGLQALLGFSDGSSALLESLWILPASLPSPVRFGLEVVGETAAVAVDDSNQGVVAYGTAATEPRVLVDGVAGLRGGPNALMADGFVQSLRDGTARLPDVHHGLWVTQLIEAIHHSADDRTEIRVVPDPITA